MKYNRIEYFVYGLASNKIEYKRVERSHIHFFMRAHTYIHTHTLALRTPADEMSEMMTNGNPYPIAFGKCGHHYAN